MIFADKFFFLLAGMDINMIFVHKYFSCTSDCKMNTHKWCAKSVEELCIGQVCRKPKDNKKLPSFLGKMMPEDNKRKSSHLAVSNGELLRAPNLNITKHG